MADALAGVLDLMGLRPRRVTVLKDADLGNGSWLVDAGDRGVVVLRRYHGGATAADLAYEHAVLDHLAAAGWVVPSPVGEPAQYRGRWYCLTRYVPGEAVGEETVGQRRCRGRDLARLHLALRGLGERIGQCPGWRALHQGITVQAGLDWDGCVRALMEVSPRLGSWAHDVAALARNGLAGLGVGDLPVLVVHGDFAEWNVHYQHGRFAGVIDFGLSHLDSRPYELAAARAYRSPQVLDGYRAELARVGWPLSDLEEAAIAPIYRCFRVDMVAWEVDHGQQTGDYDLAVIERQLARCHAAMVT